MPAAKRPSSSRSRGGPRPGGTGGSRRPASGAKRSGPKPSGPKRSGPKPPGTKRSGPKPPGAKRSGPSGPGRPSKRPSSKRPSSARPAGGARRGASSGRGAPPARRASDRRREDRPADEIPNLPGQGALTRKGAGWLKKVDALDKAGIKRPPRGGASDAWRKAAGLDADDDRPAPPHRRTSPDREPGRAGLAARAFGDDDELVLDDDAVRDEASRAVARGERPTRRSSAGRPDAADAAAQPEALPLEDEVRAELARALPKSRVPNAEAKLADAARAFRRERFADAARILRPLAERAPGAAPVRELNGLTLYRQGKWRSAAKELEAFRQLSGSTEQHPVLADCYRALHQWRAVDDLWEELRQASPSADLVAEGRIVTAGALADQDRLPAAIRLLEQGWKRPKRPQLHHLRRGYALADLYERAGEVARARELFGWVAAHDGGETGADERVRSLR
jgi:hypothetical protein